jgi:hypothetical protein
MKLASQRELSLNLHGKLKEGMVKISRILQSLSAFIWDIQLLRQTCSSHQDDISKRRPERPSEKIAITTCTRSSCRLLPLSENTSLITCIHLPLTYLFKESFECARFSVGDSHLAFSRRLEGIETFLNAAIKQSRTQSTKSILMLVSVHEPHVFPWTNKLHDDGFGSR